MRHDSSKTHKSTYTTLRIPKVGHTRQLINEERRQERTHTLRSFEKRAGRLNKYKTRLKALFITLHPKQCTHSLLKVTPPASETGIFNLEKETTDARKTSSHWSNEDAHLAAGSAEALSLKYAVKALKSLNSGSVILFSPIFLICHPISTPSSSA